jgi:hypothetical protein
MRVEGGIPVKMEVAIPAHRLAKKAAIPEVDSASEADALPRPPFPDHLGGKFVQEFGRFFKLLLRKRSENLFQDLVRRHLVLSQEGAALRREG